MIALGIDPDTKATGIAVVQTLPAGSLRPTPRVLYVATAPVKAPLSVQERVRLMGNVVWAELHSIPFNRGIDRIAVEGQRVYSKGKVRPQDLIHLAQVAGMAAAHAQMGLPEASLWIPEPVQWKGSVEKGAMQRRILGRVGLTEKLEGVEGAEGMTKTQRGHVIDAIGLAMWVATIPARRTQK